MPWWGWLLIVLAIIAVPIKLRILKNMFSKNKQHSDF